MVYLLIGILIFLAEMLIKNYVEYRFAPDTKIDVLNGKVTLRRLYNKGAVMGVLKEKTDTLKYLSSLFFCILAFTYRFLLAKKEKPLAKIGYVLFLAGAASNLYDRFKRGYVVDYFSLKIRPIKQMVFNLSDFFILIGGVLMVVFGRRRIFQSRSH